MAGNPPLNGMEDQTDEDFFDKLVDDDFGPTHSSSKLEDGSDSDETKAFANLSIDENVGETFCMQGVPNSDKTTVSSKISEEDESGDLSKTMESNEVPCESVSSFSPGASREANTSGVKEVGWNSFHTELKLNGTRPFGSDSDFFDNVEDASEDFFDKMNDIVSIPDGKTSSLNNEILLSGQGGSEHNLGDQQVSNNNLAWEDMYPGWKIDPNSGQWYQVDSFGVNSNVRESGYFDHTDGNSVMSSLQQSTNASARDASSETGASQNFSNWNQVSGTNQNGYPEHMYFDPQYPGWYYDMLTQEWRTLESYTLSLQPSMVNTLESKSHIGNSFTSHAQKSDYSNPTNCDFEKSNTALPSQNFHNQQSESWNNSCNDSLNHHVPHMWKPEFHGQADTISSFAGKQRYADTFFISSEKNNVDYHDPPLYQNARQGGVIGNGYVESQGFGSVANFAPQLPAYNVNPMVSMNFANNCNESHSLVSSVQHLGESGQQFSFGHSSGFSSDGRPPHALVAFGFGGKLLVMKESSFLAPSLSPQESKNCPVNVLNLMEVVLGSTSSASNFQRTPDSYFHALSHQSFPGPLVGGSVGNKELNKWIDERISGCESPDVDDGKSENLRLLLSLLKIACQHYGKLRSPFGTDASLRESDCPETAVAKLFASTRRSNTQKNLYGSYVHCLQNLPSEGHIQAMAAEVQDYLVSGRTVEALQCAQKGQLWGPALVLASQLGNQYYVDTVKQMALHQLVAGSPLRTLCLLIAGEPREVFSSGILNPSTPRGFTTSQRPAQTEANIVLDDWEENLAVIAANRTKDDEFVIIHLGDCLWKDRSEVIGAHICYLVAETNFEPYSDSARLCLIAADHWKHPRTYASPEAIQRTELYEYSKVIGNSQFVLLPFQPYKLIYAYMLAEVGKVADSLKYCQAVLKLLKTSRTSEVETWRQLASSLEERLKVHQQGGYATNLAPAKLVGKLLNFFDNTAHRVVGGLPPPVPSSSSQGNALYNEHLHTSSNMHRVSASQSTMAMSSLMPSASMEPISEWTSDESRKIIHNRSVSEPDFGRTPRQVASSKEETSSSEQGKTASSGSSRFSRLGFGSQLLQKTVSLVMKPKSDKQAKLGEKNKFYYDEKLKRWVEEGAELPVESSAPPPPPTSFQNGTTDYNLKSALKSDETLANGSSAFNSPSLGDSSSGMPPLSMSSNQFSARGRMGVRARYVDTFNQGVGTAGNSFHQPSVPLAKPSIAANTQFFVPAPVPATDFSMEATADRTQGTLTMDNSAMSTPQDFQSALQSSSPASMQRFPSMDNITRKGSVNEINSAVASHSRRTASWSGSINDSFTPPRTGNSTLPSMSPASLTSSVSSLSPLPMMGNGFRDELQEVEL